MQTSPLDAYHDEHGGQMVDYAGWRMPLRYGSIVEEHNQVRNSGGIFDVSHMGRLEVKGLHARRLLERVCTRRIGNMQQGQCRYSLMCNAEGGVRDDVIVMRADEDEFLVVCNGANREKIVAHLDAVKGEVGDRVKVEDKTLKTAMVAVQGPKVMDIISGVSSEIPNLKRYRFTTKNLLVVKLIVARTGYTGEDGIEVILPAGMINMAMKLIMKDVDMTSPDAAIKPTGLGARDSLRLEAGMPLYGHELGEHINAMSCGVDFAINLDKNEDEDQTTFIGQEALQAAKDNGVAQKIVGLKLDGKRTARQGMAVKAGDSAVGAVTSGCSSPTLGCSIAMALVDTAKAEVGTALQVDLGRQAVDAEVVPLPFYKRG